jgi:hypothetical protein
VANQSLYGELFSSLKGLTVQAVTSTGNDWIVEATSSQDGAQCPECGVVSRSRHSRYRRQIRDLPFQGARVMGSVALGNRPSSRSENHLPNRIESAAEMSGEAELSFHDFVHQLDADEDASRIVKALET